MGKLKKVRLGVIGLGGMGTSHTQGVQDGLIKGCELTAVCDMDASRLDGFGEVVLKYTDAGKPVDLPMDGKAFERQLKRLIKESRFVKKTAKPPSKQDMKKSFI